MENHALKNFDKLARKNATGNIKSTEKYSKPGKVSCK